MLQAALGGHQRRERSRGHRQVSFETVGRKAAIWAALLVAATSGLSCNDDDSDAADTKQAPETPSGLGKLSEPSGNGPEATPLRLLRYVQLGSTPLAAAEYDPLVVQAVGSRAIMGALGDQRNTLSVISPKVVSSEKTARGTLVVVNVESKNRPVGRYSFLVGRVDGSWKIRYDTLLGDGLAAYVQSRTQLDIDPDAKKPSSEAAVAGREEAEAYRAVFAPRPFAGSGDAAPSGDGE